MLLIQTFQQVGELYKANKKNAGGHFCSLWGILIFRFHLISQMEPIYVCVFTLMNFVRRVQKSEHHWELLSEEGCKSNWFLLCKSPMSKTFIREKEMKSSEPINHLHA